MRLPQTFNKIALKELRTKIKGMRVKLEGIGYACRDIKETLSGNTSRSNKSRTSN
jgi:hypothetical protein